MQTVEALIRDLQKFPPDARCYAYEGESCCVVVVRGDGEEKTQLGYIKAYDDDSDDGPAVITPEAGVGDG